MPNTIQNDDLHLRQATAEGRQIMERQIAPWRARFAALGGLVKVLIGAVAIAVTAAGFSISAIFLILNLIFHYSPS